MTATRPSPLAAESGLPEGWAAASVANALDVKYGKGLKESNRSSGSVPVYGSNGVVGHHQAALTKGPTIILGRKGSIGTVHFSASPCWPIDTTYFIDEFLGLKPEFIVYALNAIGLKELDTSTAIPGLNRDDLYSQVFPLPPAAEQQRIAEKIDLLLTRVNLARQHLARVSSILKGFHQAVLAAACSGRLTADWRGKAFGIPDNDLSTWKESPLRQLLREPLRNGHSARASADGRGIRTLTLSAVTYGDFSERNTKMTIADPRKTQDLWLQPGDILIERSNTPELVGTARFYRGEPRFAIFPDLLIRVRVNKDVLPEFVEFSLRTNSARDYFMQRAQGSAGTMPKIDQGVIEEFPLMIPSLKEQQEIVGRVEFLFKLADTIEKRVAAARMRAEKLTQAILAKAFRGELVPTEAELARREGRSYEPASALLARIRAERESSAGSSHSRAASPLKRSITRRSRKLRSK